ncbi:hypothetical protein DPMN_070072 [Dreissena polymorpha]|uniref:Uncharacterized protein n=1 Tax=Dreissena polymorpha TaxID=45954 RepID=A0A9D4BUV1_DREPO|nr:hypothetical protein DPMN_070072 [Dreissena polymorpha]
MTNVKVFFSDGQTDILTDGQFNCYMPPYRGHKKHLQSGALYFTFTNPLIGILMSAPISRGHFQAVGLTCLDWKNASAGNASLKLVTWVGFVLTNFTSLIAWKA